VGRQRGAGMGGGHDEREQTLNQMLVEMDGFEGSEGIIVIAAPNNCMSCFMISCHFFLGIIHHHAFSLSTHHNFIFGFFKGAWCLSMTQFIRLVLFQEVAH
jgi:hypothetical protein